MNKFFFLHHKGINIFLYYFWTIFKMILITNIEKNIKRKYIVVSIKEFINKKEK